MSDLNDFSTPSCTCKKCQTTYPLLENYWHKEKGRLTNTCLPCHREVANLRYHLRTGKNPEVIITQKQKKLLALQGLKACALCNRKLPQTKQYFKSDVSKSDGLTSRCKECQGGTFEQLPQPTQPGYKICRKCGNEYPLTPEYWYPGKRDGYVSPCKQCRGMNFVQRNEHPIDSIKCPVCKNVLPASPKYFHRSKGSARGIGTTCKTCAKKRSRRWAELNRIRSRASANQGKQRRRARAQLLAADYTVAEWHECLRYWNGVCAYCGHQQSFWNVLEQDHYISLVHGGGYTAKNIVPACRSCNGSKSDNTPVEWITEQFGKRKASIILQRIRDYFDSLD